MLDKISETIRTRLMSLKVKKIKWSYASDQLLGYTNGHYTSKYLGLVWFVCGFGIRFEFDIGFNVDLKKRQERKNIMWICIINIFYKYLLNEKI